MTKIKQKRPGIAGDSNWNPFRQIGPFKKGFGYVVKITSNFVNPNFFSVKILLQKKENKQKEAGVGQFKKVFVTLSSLLRI